MDREWPIPEPCHLRDALNLIVDSGTRTRADLLSVEFTMHPGDIENLAGLPTGWFNKRQASVIQLSLKSDPLNQPATEGFGEVLPFVKR